MEELIMFLGITDWYQSKVKLKWCSGPELIITCFAIYTRIRLLDELIHIVEEPSSAEAAISTLDT